MLKVCEAIANGPEFGLSSEDLTLKKLEQAIEQVAQDAKRDR